MRTLDQIYMYQGSGNDVTLPILFQRDSKGKIRQWSVRTEGAIIIVEHGIMDGKMQQQRTTAKPKNVGKVNATTAEEQAVIEAKAKHTKQIDREDYHEDVELAGRQTRPMLALDYHKNTKRVNWENTVGQPKLDGLRLVAGFRHRDQRDPSNFEMMTRKGETHNVDHLIDPAFDLMRRADQILVEMGYPEGSCIGVDGEVYLHGKTLQWIGSRAKKYYEGETELLEYHVFDLVILNVPYSVRHDVLKQAFDDLFLCADQGGLVRVESCVLSSDNLELAHGLYVEQGYEGLIIRHLDGLYKLGTGGTRSPDLFKYKLFEEEECLIIDVWEDDNGNGMWKVRRKPTLEFGANVVVDVTPKRTHTERKQMLLEPEKWIGKWATIRYQVVTPKGSLEFPTGRDLRECDELGEPIV